MKKITFEKLLEQYIEITGEEEKRERLSHLREWNVLYRRQNGKYEVLIEPPGIDPVK